MIHQANDVVVNKCILKIPIFTSQLEKSRDAVSISNMRAAYAQAQAEYLVDQNSADAITSADGNTKYTPASDGTDTVEVSGVILKEKNNSDVFSGLKSELPFADLITTEPAAGTYKMTFSYDANGVITAIAFN